MSFLDSIMSSMDKTAQEQHIPLTDAEKEKRKKQQEREKVAMEAEKKRLADSKVKFEKHLLEFREKSDGELTFPPMDPNLRALLHDVASSFDLISHSFGDENERFCVVFRNPPSEELLFVLKKFNGIRPKEPELSAELEEAKVIKATKAVAAQMLRSAPKQNKAPSTSARAAAIDSIAPSPEAQLPIVHAQPSLPFASATATAATRKRELAYEVHDSNQLELLNKISSSLSSSTSSPSAPRSAIGERKKRRMMFLGGSSGTIPLTPANSMECIPFPPGTFLPPAPSSSPSPVRPGSPGPSFATISPQSSPATSTPSSPMVHSTSTTPTTSRSLNSSIDSSVLAFPSSTSTSSSPSIPMTPTANSLESLNLKASEDSAQHSLNSSATPSPSSSSPTTPAPSSVSLTSTSLSPSTPGSTKPSSSPLATATSS